MKDGLDISALKRLAANLHRAYARFPHQAFIRDASQGLADLELKERVQHIIVVLATHLPDDFERSVKILLKAAQNWDRGDPDDPLRGFAAWPVIDYVAVHGLQQPKVALAALRRLTGLFSAEFAIRPFITTYPEQTLQALEEWTQDSDEHVRRLVSEGARPKLPWASRLPEFERNPKPVLTLLEKLKDDPSAYVRRSVANNLNDIAKDHPDLVIEVCRSWLREPTPRREWREWIIRHATRTLVKAGHPGVWELLGYAVTPQVQLNRLQVQRRTLQLGDDLVFAGTLQSKADHPQRLVVDYAVHHMKANGQTKPKVFKLKTLSLAPGEQVAISKRHPFRQITTRQYYAGQHTVEVLVNGQSLARCHFQLTL